MKSYEVDFYFEFNNIVDNENKLYLYGEVDMARW